MRAGVMSAILRLAPSRRSDRAACRGTHRGTATTRTGRSTRGRGRARSSPSTMFSREEVVGALVLDLRDEGVVLGAVVGVVERRRHRILVGGIGLAVRVRRQQREVLGDARAERPIAGARGSPRKTRWPGARAPSGRSATITRTTASRSRPSSASTCSSAMVASGRHVDHEERAPPSAKSSGPMGAVRTRAEPSRATTSAGSTDRSGASPGSGRARRARVTAAGSSGLGQAAAAARSDDARVAPDDHRRARPGPRVQGR